MKLNATEKAIKMFVKTRYENRTRSIEPSFSEPFFDSVSNCKYFPKITRKILLLSYDLKISSAWLEVDKKALKFKIQSIFLLDFTIFSSCSLIFLDLNFS